VQTSKTNFEQIPVAIVKRIVEELHEQKESEDLGAHGEIHRRKVESARVPTDSHCRKGY
jgi:hypothetical protein